MRLVGAVAALLRRLRAERGVAILLFVLVAVTSFVVAAGPRLFDRVADDGLRYEVARATSAQRNIQFSTVDQIRAETAIRSPASLTAGRRSWQRLPESVGQLIDETLTSSSTSTRFRLTDPPNYTTFVTLRQPGRPRRPLDLVEGRWPAACSRADRADEPPRFEIAALARGRRGQLLVELGDTSSRRRSTRGTRCSGPSSRDRRRRSRSRSSACSRSDDRRAPYWFDDDRRSPKSPSAGRTTPPSRSRRPCSHPRPTPTSSRWACRPATAGGPVDAERLDAGDVDAPPGRPAPARVELRDGRLRCDGRILYRSGLLDVLERYAAQRTATEAALSVAALGPLAVAAGALGLIGVLIVGRRRAALALARGRGASAAQLLAAQLWEGLLISVPAAVVGLLLARAAVPSRPAAAVVDRGHPRGPGRDRAPARRDVAGGPPGATRPGARRAAGRSACPRAGSVSRRSSSGSRSPRRGCSASVAWAASDPAAHRPASTRSLPRRRCSSVWRSRWSRSACTRSRSGRSAWLTARRRDLVPVARPAEHRAAPERGYLPLLILTLTVAIGHVLVGACQATIERRPGRGLVAGGRRGSTGIEALPDAIPGTRPSTRRRSPESKRSPLRSRRRPTLSAARSGDPGSLSLHRGRPGRLRGGPGRVASGRASSRPPSMTAGPLRERRRRRRPIPASYRRASRTAGSRCRSGTSSGTGSGHSR